MSVKSFKDGKKKRAPMPDGKTIFKVSGKTATFAVQGVKYWCPILTAVRVEPETPKKAWGTRITHRFNLAFEIPEGFTCDMTKKKWIWQSDDRLVFAMEVKQDFATFDNARLLEAAAKAFAGSILGVGNERLRNQVAGIIIKAWTSQWETAANWHSAVQLSEEQATIVAVMEL